MNDKKRYSEQYKEFYERHYPRPQPKEEGGFFNKPETPENRTKRRSQEKYDHCSNTCPTCHTQRSAANQTCMCD